MHHAHTLWCLLWHGMFCSALGSERVLACVRVGGWVLNLCPLVLSPRLIWSPTLLAVSSLYFMTLTRHLSSQRLKRKAEERNPDEFYFAMEKARTKGGVHDGRCAAFPHPSPCLLVVCRSPYLSNSQHETCRRMHKRAAYVLASSPLNHSTFQSDWRLCACSQKAQSPHFCRKPHRSLRQTLLPCQSAA